MTYKEQMKSPKWQKKRLEIMQRDNFKCTICGNDKDQLHIHHLYYRPGFKIFDYENESLVTVCNKCHEKLTHDLPKLSGLIAFKILKKEFEIL